MREPEMLDFSTKNLAVETIEQFYFTIEPERKYELLIKLWQARTAQTGRRLLPHAEGHRKALSKTLEAHQRSRHDPRRFGPERPRPRNEARFREGKVRLLVAYRRDRSRDRRLRYLAHHQLRRAVLLRRLRASLGRTGRMGREGVAFTFITPEEGNELTRIEMPSNRLLNRDEIPGFTSYVKPQPTDDFDAEEGEEPAAKAPVFGREVKRYRRALVAIPPLLLREGTGVRAGSVHYEFLFSTAGIKCRPSLAKRIIRFPIQKCAVRSEKGA
ncbi:MAG: hypothetical protein MZW92_03770 [Comamonadaceae bacterium]|nr:hypothetical protein [Comamonadaceae bacterium]